MNKLSTDSFYLLVISMLFATSMITATTFINVFIMRSTDNNVSLIIGRSILDFSVLLITFVSGTKLLRYIKITNIMRIGLLAISIYYILIIVLQNHITAFIIPLGIFSGLGSGLYWFSTNILLMEHVKPKQQGKFFSYRQTAGFAFAVLIPFLSGIFITLFHDLTGYYILFGISISLFIIAAILLQKISGFKAHHEIKVLEALFYRGSSSWAACKLLAFMAGLRESIIGFTTVLFVFLIFQSEFYIGTLTSLSAFVGVISSLIFARIFNPKKRRNYYFLVAVISLSMYVLQAVFPYPYVIVIVMIGLGIVANWGSTIMQTMLYQLAFKTRGEEHKNAFLVSSEFPMAAGRILGLVIALGLTQAFTEQLSAYRILFVVVGCTFVIEYLYVNRKVGWLSE